MPLCFNEQFGASKIALWHITEQVEDLFQLYEPKDEEREVFQNFKNESRKREWLSVRILLESVVGKGATIKYLPSGKPYIEGHDGGFSISHATTMSGIIVSPYRYIGIDIEQSSRSVERVFSRFLNEEEREIFSPSDGCGLKLWCAKEAVFKAAGEKNVDFSSQILLKKKTSEPLVLNAEFRGAEDREFVVDFLNVEEHTIAWIG